MGRADPLCDPIVTPTSISTARCSAEGGPKSIRLPRGLKTMNLELYSDRAKQAVQSAQSLALARRH